MILILILIIHLFKNRLSDFLKRIKIFKCISIFFYIYIISTMYFFTFFFNFFKIVFFLNLLFYDVNTHRTETNCLTRF